MVEATATSPYDSMTATQIKEHLTALAERHIADRLSYRQLRHDAAKDLDVRISEQDGVALTVITMRADGLSIEDFEAFSHDDVFYKNISILDPALTCRKLPDDVGEGAYALYQHIKTPIVVSNRYSFQIVHKFSPPEGGHVQLVTSLGTK